MRHEPSRPSGSGLLRWPSGLAFFLLLTFVILCIVLDGLEQVWVEWKRLLWGQLGMAIREKIRLTMGRPLSRGPR